MRKAAIILVILVAGFVRSLDAQVAVSVTNPTNASPNLATSYVSLSDAITALNAVTSLSGTVILTCAGGGAETAPAGGYVISYTAAGSSSNYILIDGNGSTITAFSPQVAGQVHNAIFKIVGSDYLTLQNFVMTENAGNTVNTLATNTKTEFGVGLFIASATNGAQNNTIQNNTITLSSTYQNAIGIFSTSSSSQTNGTLEATATSGTNSNNRFYGNTISSVAYGMYFICPPVTATIFESGTDIGGTSSATKNTITFGLATTADFSWNRLSAVKPAGIYFRNGGYGSSVRFNSITSNNLAYPQSGGVAGIVTTNATNPSGVTYTTNWSDNELVSISNTGTTQVSGIDFGFGLNTGTLIANNNMVTVTSNATAARSAAIQGINAPFCGGFNNGQWQHNYSQ